jgi:hypothetical protein
VVDGSWVHDPEQTFNTNDVGSHNNILSIKTAG